MKTVFVVNPCAGKGKSINNLIKKIEEISNEEKEIYITKFVGDATRFVRDYCEKHSATRFIACGGDGTLNEVLNGAAGFDEAEIGVIPIGTGNDFCRNFKNEKSFDNLLKQIHGKTVRCDAIRYTTQTPDGEIKGYCANMFNIGFDCNVADMTAKVKKNPFIPGSMAYFVSIFAMLVTKKGANLKIEIDGEESYNGKLLLTSIANGSYCGGGVMSNPLASICDGAININIIKNIPRYKFLYLLPFYMKGTHMKIKGIDRIIQCAKCSKIKITPLNGSMRLCIDGEIIDAGKTEFEICPSIFNFVVPSLIESEDLVENFASGKFVAP